MTTTTEIGPDLFRISTYVPDADLQFCQFLLLTEKTLQGLADLKPKRLATMHGTSYVGDGARALRSLAVVLKETLGGPR